MNINDKIYIAGHTGMVGGALLNELKHRGYNNLHYKTHLELDLTNQSAVYQYLDKIRPDYVFMCAAKVGGIHANNTYPADFIFENLLIQTNLIDASYRFGTKKLLMLGSSCIFPKYCNQPMTEDDLLSGTLEPTNEAYAIAKIAGIKMVQAYRKQHNFNGICLMPSNLYGVGDTYDINNSHVVPSLIMKFHNAKVHNLPTVTLWGDGSAYREFLYVTDLVDAMLFTIGKYDSNEIINIGCGSEIRIHGLAKLISDVVGFKGEIKYDHSMPNGTARKLLNINKITSMGWKPKISLQTGLKLAYADYMVRCLKLQPNG